MYIYIYIFILGDEGGGVIEQIKLLFSWARYFTLKARKKCVSLLPFLSEKISGFNNLKWLYKRKQHKKSIFSSMHINSKIHMYSGR